jgi:membrane protein implicated in regulation of membrane protease activity
MFASTDTLDMVWGLSFDQTMLLGAIFLIVIDIFFASDIPTHTGYVLIAVVVGRFVPAHVMLQVLCGVIAWCGIVVFHYTLWRTFIQAIVNRKIAPDRYQPSTETLNGSVGRIREISGEQLVEIDDELWLFTGSDDLVVDDEVTVVSSQGGTLVVSRRQRKE